jgi:hypothetical protein
MKTKVLMMTVFAMTSSTWAQAPTSKPVDTGKKSPAAQGTEKLPPARPGLNPHQASAVADEIPTWAKPLYRTAKGQEKTIVDVERFPYREETYLNTKPAEYMTKDQYRYVTPEDALLSRLSAMANLDYEGWLKSWDKASQERLKEMDARDESGMKKRLNQWQGVMAQVHPLLVRRITTGKYVIVTYKLLNKAGQDAGMFEFPTPFVQEGGLWIGTDALMNDPFFNLVPWVSGHLSDEKDFRPLSETVIK